IAQVAFDLGELRTVVKAGKNLAVDKQIEDGDLIAGIEQFGHEVQPTVPSPAGYEDTLEPISHHAFQCPLAITRPEPWRSLPGRCPSLSPNPCRCRARRDTAPDARPRRSRIPCPGRGHKNSRRRCAATRCFR